MGLVSHYSPIQYTVLVSAAAEKCSCHVHGLGNSQLLARTRMLYTYACNAHAYRNVCELRTQLDLLEGLGGVVCSVMHVR